ncbi:hypothetical protein PIB30_049443 [Stylosanthes scabra]|uniref:Uncharacterized protein n=1 Tax=Stylosanthes scabra TaxID=79078 RepID=A0ABU6UG20_9FABA|nr:hypothetical protein [Stylosanthes scabra]
MNNLNSSPTSFSLLQPSYPAVALNVMLVLHVIPISQFGIKKRMENLNLALLSSQKPLPLGHFGARDAKVKDVFNRKHFSIWRVFIAHRNYRYRVYALSHSNAYKAKAKPTQNNKSVQEKLITISFFDQRVSSLLD